MLRQLLESRPQRPRTRSAAVLSLVVHAALVGTAVAGTRIVVDDVREGPMEPVVHFVRPLPTKEPEPAPRPRPAPPAPTPQPAVPDQPVVVAPVEVPTGITPPDPNATTTLEPTFFPPGLPGTGEPGGEPGTGDPLSSGTGEAMWAEDVEQPARILGRQREPRYPDMLKSSRVEGRVVVSYVVDSLGRVEPNSIKVLESAHALFEPSVRQAVLATRFRPAEWRKQRVRQLVQQAFVFTLQR